MKLLILFLLLSSAAQAQSIADAARQERERQTVYKNVPVYTSADIHSTVQTASPAATPPSGEKPAAKPASASVPATSPAAPATTTTEIPIDPVDKWNADVAKLRAIIVELQDRETAEILNVNQLTNQYFAPVSTPETQSETQARLTAAQRELLETKKTLQTARETLQAMETQGPPKKP